MLKFVNNFNKNIRKHKLIKGEKRLLISVSGGQDSVSLILIMYLLQTQMESVFGSIYLNHFWQKSSFFAMLHISKLNYSFESQLILFLPVNVMYSEQSARDWRGSCTQRILGFYQYDLCVQGHSKSDRAETILFNLIRGAGMRGVSALHWKQKQKYFSINKFHPRLYLIFKQTHIYNLFYLRSQLESIRTTLREELYKEGDPFFIFGIENNRVEKQIPILLAPGSGTKKMRKWSCGSRSFLHRSKTNKFLMFPFLVKEGVFITPNTCYYQLERVTCVEINNNT